MCGCLAVLLLVLFCFSLSWLWLIVGLKARTPNAVMGLSMMVLFPLTFVSSVFAPPETPPPAVPPRPALAGPVPARPLRIEPFTPAVAAAAAEDELTVKIELPAGGRFEFLPGALEVLEGPDLQREIRFVSGVDATPEFTIGRTRGPADRHVQLSAPTVSRVHARMRFAGGEWSIRNLSTTNPLRVNGHELTREEEGRVLADGDRIEVGEVVLRFRETVG